MRVFLTSKINSNEQKEKITMNNERLEIRMKNIILELSSEVILRPKLKSFNAIM